MIDLQVLICCLLWATIAHSATYADSIGGTAIPVSSLKVDEQLYSRQIFVYGKNAQQSLSSSHVIVKGSNTPLAAEIVKNLALAGVGKITIVSDTHSSLDAASLGSSVSLTGGESTAEYARSLNPLIAVTSNAVDLYNMCHDFYH
jgi:tRNA A37 threonylcarbamoyladenosine dehydratase